MSLLNLPVELKDLICQHLASSKLAILSRTHSSLYPITQRILYHQIDISSLSQNLDIIMTLANRPDTACFVRHFSLRILTPPREDDGGIPHHAFYSALATAIINMSGLISLDMSVDSGASWVLPHHSRPFPNLLRFTSSFPFNTDVADFLELTPALRELDLDPTSLIHIPSLSSSTVPHLTRFGGSADAAQSIVPGRPLQSIHLYGAGHLSDNHVISFSKSSAPIILFEAAIQDYPISLLQMLAKHLPSLAYCRITANYAFDAAPGVVSKLFDV